MAHKETFSDTRTSRPGILAGGRSRRMGLDKSRLTIDGETMLERAAAQQWGVEAAECRAENHRVVHAPSGRSAARG